MAPLLLLRAAAAAAAAVLVSADSLWPVPLGATSIDTGPQCLSLPTSTPFSSVGMDSDVLTAALTRYQSIIFGVRVPSVNPSPCTGVGAGAIASVTVNVTTPDLNLTVATVESYSLVISSPAVAITAPTAYGALRALESLSQLVDYRPDLGATAFVLPASASIVDAPRFAHRGALVDTARHFMTLPRLYAFIDALAYNRMNVFHWHVVDDNSFPFVSSTFPSLAAQGAYGAPDQGLVAAHTYSPADVQNVIAYARLRGVRVVPEFDTPGHSQSWGKGTPGLLTQCYNGSVPVPGLFGPIDPTQPASYTFIEALFREVATVFPDAYMHIGGDEVSFDCWASNPAINSWMAANGIAAGNYSALESVYVQKVIDIVQGLGKHSVAWEEVYDNHLNLPPTLIVNVWKYHSTTATATRGERTTAPPTWQSELFNVTNSGFTALVSSPWYINYDTVTTIDWPAFYATDITNFGGTPAQQALVVGGEFSIWSEDVNGAVLDNRAWPRGSAIAEALWTNPGAAANITDATLRIHAQECRLQNRGIAAGTSSGPAFCPREWQPAYTPPWGPSSQGEEL
jgi:hexosaminidase